MRLRVIKHETCEGPGSIADWAAERGHVLATTELALGEALPGPDDFDILVLMGGSMSVNDEDRLAWLRPEKAFVRAAVEGGKKVLGICLGAQMIASALGAAVTRNAFKEIGWFPVEATAQGLKHPFFRRFPKAVPVFHWHGETFALPQGAELLARSAACEHQVYAIGRNVLALQCHVEVTAGSAREMAVAGAGELDLSQPFVQSQAVLLGQPEALARMAPLCRNLLDDWMAA